MLRGNFTAIELAVLAGLKPARVERAGVREFFDYILIGPDGSDDEIATVACRCFVRRKGRFDEHRVRRVVERYGFSYVAPAENRDVVAAED